MNRCNVLQLISEKALGFKLLNIKRKFYSASLVGLLFSPALSAAPTTPSGLSVDVYSNTALELFWERASSDVRVIGYELNKNGNRIWLGDVTSYYDSKLQRGSSHNYAIVAIDESGSRSADSWVVTVSLQGGRTSNCVSDTSCESVSFSYSESSDSVASQNDETLSGVELVDISLSIYSKKSAELIWQRNNAVSSYDIYRDGVFMKQIDGNSFYDPNRERGHDYQYKIVALGIDGNQLATATIDNSGILSINSASASSGDDYSSNSGTGSSSSSSSSSSSDSSSGSSSNSSSHSSSDSTSINTTSDSNQYQSSSIKVSTYSSSAGELFWDRAPGETKYYVYRNGHLTVITHGTSYFDNSLAKNSYYDYEIYLEQDGFLQLYGTASISTGN